MKYFVILILVGLVGLNPLQHAFAHEVTELYGVGGCPVNSCGVTDWDLYRIASETMFYVSLLVYAMIIMVFYYSWYKKNSISTSIRK